MRSIVAGSGGNVSRVGSGWRRMASQRNLDDTRPTERKWWRSTTDVHIKTNRNNVLRIAITNSSGVVILATIFGAIMVVISISGEVIEVNGNCRLS